METEFDLCRIALEEALRQAFPGATVEEFGRDTPNPGVKVDLQTERGLANVELWKNLSFDVEAIENRTGQVLVRKSVENVTPGDVASAIAELAAALRSRMPT